MIFELFSSKKKANYYKLSFYDGFSNQQNTAILGSLLFERFYSVRKLNKSVSKRIEPFGRYLLACLIVTKFDCENEIISQVNYFELIAQIVGTIDNTMIDNDVSYLSELMYSKPA